MRRQFATFRDFHLRIRTAAAAGPRHNIVSLIDLAAFKAFLQEGPDGFVILGAEREIAATPFRVAEFLYKLVGLCSFRLAAWSRDRHFVVGAKMFGQLTKLVRAVPVHPIAESLRLFGLSSREPEHSSLALVNEVVDAEFMDGGLCPEPKLLFHFDFDPQPLAVETVLVSLIVTRHREESLIGVLVRSAPRVVNPHWVIRGDWTVEKAPSLAACVLLAKLTEDLPDLPKLQNGMFAGDKIAV